MLRAVLADFRAWGRFPVLTTIDRRLSDVPLPADRVVPLDGEDYPRSLVDMAKQCLAALIIAPETDGTLVRLNTLVEDAGAFLLGSRPEGVIVATDKWECHRLFAQAGLPTPATLRTSPAEALPAAQELGFPLVVKPIDGAGCAGIGLVAGSEFLEPALDRLGFRHGELLLQRFVPGAHASVSLLAVGGDSLALSLNEQWVDLGIPSHYRGGVASISHHSKEEALELARRGVALVPGLRGYVGVDLVLNREQCFLIEINPRLTTSYVGLRRIINVNLAEAIWRVCREGIFPRAVMVAGTAAFRQEQLDAV